MPDDTGYDFDAERRHFEEARRRLENELDVAGLSGRKPEDAKQAVEAAGGRVEIYDADADNSYSADIDTGRVRLWVRGGQVLRASLG